MKKALAFILLIAVSFAIKISAQTNTENNTDQLISDDRPVFVNTGNQEKDQFNYEEAMTKWLSEHPENAKIEDSESNSILIQNNFQLLENDSIGQYNLFREAVYNSTTPNSTVGPYIIKKKNWRLLTQELKDFIQSSDNFIIKK